MEQNKMNIKPTDRVSLYCRPYTTREVDREYGVVRHEVIELTSKFLEIYTAIGKDNKKIHKLYYLKDKLGNFIKSKLVYFKDDKKDKIVYSENKRKEWWA
jgi:hypothetical protein